MWLKVVNRCLEISRSADERIAWFGSPSPPSAQPTDKPKWRLIRALI
jgi:hypothetical protein